MKKIVVSLMALTFVTLGYSKPKIGVRVSGGFDWGFGNRLGEKRYVDSSFDNSTPIIGSYGQGTEPGFDFVIEATKNLSIYFGSGYKFGIEKTTSSADDRQRWSGNHHTDGSSSNAISSMAVDTTAGSGLQSVTPVAGQSESTIKASYIPVNLGINAKFGKKRIRPFLEAGLVLALGGNATSITTIAPSEYNSETRRNDQKIYELTYKPGIGFSGGAGVSIQVTKKISIDLGVTGQMLTMKRDTLSLTKWTHHGRDQLNNRNENSVYYQDWQQKWVYEESVDAEAGSASAIEEAQKNGYQILNEVTDNFHTIGAKMSISVMF